MGEDNQACRGPQGRSDATGSPASRMRSCPCDTASRLCVPTVLCSPAFRSVSSSSPSASNGRRAQRSSGFAKRRRKQLLTGGAAPRQPVSATPEIWAKEWTDRRPVHSKPACVPLGPARRNRYPKRSNRSPGWIVRLADSISWRTWLVANLARGSMSPPVGSR
jgi:hypothetical protein